jgi:hypothetical protein
VSGPPPATTTWNPSDKNASITLSGGNLTAASSAGSFVSLRAIASHSTGKFYRENTVVQSANPNNINAGGIANSTAGLSNYMGVDTNSVSIFGAGGVFLNNVNIATVAAYGVGDVLCDAVDLGALLIWFRTNGGLWNNSGTANPATGAGGISIASLAGGPYLPSASMDTTIDIMTANFGATAYAQSVPSGFGNW